MGLNFNTPLVQAWYGWASFVALAVTIAVAFWIFYDAGRRGEVSLVWKAFSVVSFVAVLPSLLIWAIPSLTSGSGAAAVEPLAYIGLGGGVLALISLVGYLIWARQQVEMQLCPRCGEPLHPSWDYCPYCERQETVEPPPTSPPVAAAPPPMPPMAPPAPGPSFSHASEASPPVYEAVPAPEPSAPVEQKTELLEGAGMGELAWLVILSGSHVGKEFRLGEITSVGRSPSDNDVVLDDGAVSRQHAKIRLQEGAFLLHDLGSTGGTLVRQEGTEEWEEVHRYRLNDGDRVKMGRVILGFIEVAKDSK